MLGGAAAPDFLHDASRHLGAGHRHDVLEHHVALVVEQSAERTGDDRLSARGAEKGRRMGDAEGEVLDLLHVDQLASRSQGEAVAVTGDRGHAIGVRIVERARPARGDDGGLREQGDRLSRGQVNRRGAHHLAVLDQKLEAGRLLEYVQIRACRRRAHRVSHGDSGGGAADRARGAVSAGWDHVSLQLPIVVAVEDVPEGLEGRGRLESFAHQDADQLGVVQTFPSPNHVFRELLFAIADAGVG